MKPGRRHVIVAVSGLALALLAVAAVGGSPHKAHPGRYVNAAAIGESTEPVPENADTATPFPRPIIPPRVTTSTTSMITKGEIAGVTVARAGLAPDDLESRSDSPAATTAIERRAPQVSHVTLGPPPTPA